MINKVNKDTRSPDSSPPASPPPPKQPRLLGRDVRDEAGSVSGDLDKILQFLRSLPSSPAACFYKDRLTPLEGLETEAEVTAALCNAVSIWILFRIENRNIKHLLDSLEAFPPSLIPHLLGYLTKQQLGTPRAVENVLPDRWFLNNDFLEKLNGLLSHEDIHIRLGSVKLLLRAKQCGAPLDTNLVSRFLNDCFQVIHLSHRDKSPVLWSELIEVLLSAKELGISLNWQRILSSIAGSLPTNPTYANTMLSEILKDQSTSLREDAVTPLMYLLHNQNDSVKFKAAKLLMLAKEHGAPVQTEKVVTTLMELFCKGDDLTKLDTVNFLLKAESKGASVEWTRLALDVDPLTHEIDELKIEAARLLVRRGLGGMAVDWERISDLPALMAPEEGEVEIEDYLERQLDAALVVVDAKERGAPVNLDTVISVATRILETGDRMNQGKAAKILARTRVKTSYPQVVQTLMDLLEKSPNFELKLQAINTLLKIQSDGHDIDWKKVLPILSPSEIDSSHTGKVAQFCSFETTNYTNLLKAKLLMKLGLRGVNVNWEFVLKTLTDQLSDDEPSHSLLAAKQLIKARESGVEVESSKVIATLRELIQKSILNREEASNLLRRVESFQP